MPNLINNSAELKAHFAGLSLNFNWPNIKSYEEDVERDVIAETIGPEALEYFQGNLDGLTSVKQQVLILLQRSTAYLTVLQWTQFALFQFEDKALFIAKTASGLIPSDKKLIDLKAKCEELGFNFLDKAIDLMERNLDQFPDYRDSAIRLSFNTGFMKTGIEFSAQRNISNSRVTFLSMYAIMLEVQDECLPGAMTPAYYDLFKERYLDDDLSPDEKKLLPLIRKSVAMFTIAEACKQLPVQIKANGLFINKYLNSIDYAMKDPAGLAEKQFLQDDHEEKGSRFLGKLKDLVTELGGTLPGYIAPVVVDVQVNCKESGLYLQ